MTMDDRANDPRFREPGVVAPMTFLVLFVIFIYGALTIGMLGLANWFIHSQQLTFFVEKGFLGVALMAILLMAFWATVVFTIAAIPYFILRARGRYILASKVASVIIVLLFHILVFPCIMWRVVRQNSPQLRHHYRQKLKAMVNGRRMQERLQERRNRLQGQNNIGQI